MDLSDSTLIFSARSSSGHEKDAVNSERCDSGLHLPQGHTSSRSSSSRRSISRLKHSVSATMLIGTPLLMGDGMRNNVEISGNRICFVDSRDIDSSNALARNNTGSDVSLVPMSSTVQKEVVVHCDRELADEVLPVGSLKIGDDVVPGITDSASSVAANNDSTLVSTLDSSRIANDPSVVVVPVVVENELSADDADYRPATKIIPSVKDLATGVDRNSPHDSPSQEPSLVSTSGVDTNSTNSNSFDRDVCSSRPLAADVTRLRRANPLHLSRSFSSAPQSNTTRSYDKCQSDVFGRSVDLGNRNNAFGGASFEQDLTAEDLEVGSPAIEEVTLDVLLGEYLVTNHSCTFI